MPRSPQWALDSLKLQIYQGALGTIMHAEAMFSHDKLIHVPAGDWRTLKVVSTAAGVTAPLSASLRRPRFITMHVIGTDKWVEARNDSHSDTPSGKGRF